MKTCPYCQKENFKNADLCSCGYYFNKELYQKLSMEKEQKELLDKKLEKHNKIMFSLLLNVKNLLIDISIIIVCSFYFSYRDYKSFNFYELAQSFFTSVFYLIGVFIIGAGLAFIIKRKTQPFSWSKINNYSIFVLALLLLMDINHYF